MQPDMRQPRQTAPAVAQPSRQPLASAAAAAQAGSNANENSGGEEPTLFVFGGAGGTGPQGELMGAKSDFHECEVRHQPHQSPLLITSPPGRWFPALTAH